MNYFRIRCFWWAMLNRLDRSAVRTKLLRRVAGKAVEWISWPYRAVVRGAGAGEAATQFTPIMASFSAVAVTTAILFGVESYLNAQHLVIAYLFPTTLIAIRYGSSLAFLTSFASGIAAAYFLFPPKFSLYISDSLHVAELGFFMLLALLASKVVSLLAHDIRLGNSLDHEPN